MKQMKYLLTLLFVSICAVQSAWADRSAPELPATVVPESGQSYYIYNVMENKFLCRSTTSTSYVAIGTYGEKIIFTSTGTENEYTLQWADNNYYFRAYDTYVSVSATKDSKLSMFSLDVSSKGYTIQRSSNNTSYYKDDEYIGFNGTSGDRVTPALAEGSIHWVFYSVDEAEYYMAKHKLYTYLEAADSYNFYIDQYEAVYNDPTSTTAQLLQAYETLKDAVSVSGQYVSPSWSDYPILFQNNTDNKWTTSSGSLVWTISGNKRKTVCTSTMTATVNVDTDATLVYTFKGNSYSNLRTFIDGELVQTVKRSQAGKNRRYYVEMTPGKHDIAWTCVFNGNENLSTTYYNYLSDIGVEITPVLTTEQMTVEGQLGTEVLKQVEHVKDVRKLVVNGPIGADDWTNIAMMTSLFSIDLSNAEFTALPASQFTNAKFAFLHTVKLPEGLLSIGNYAFENSDIDDIELPSTLQSIGNNAFYNSKIRSAYIPEGVTSVGKYAFQNCYFLENATYPATAQIIPQYCFYNCSELRSFAIPEGITSVGQRAFENATQFNPRFPSTISDIYRNAFYNTATDSLFVTEDMTVYYNAFSNCSSLVYAEWPTSFATVKYTGNIETSTYAQHTYCTKLNKVVLKSPSVIKDADGNNNYKQFLNGCTNPELIIFVPSFLFNAYKLDPYWYNYSIQGFNTADVKDWVIKGKIVLGSGERLEGTPNVKINGGGSLTINGDDAMNIDNFITRVNGTYTDQYRAMVISNCNNIKINGKYTYQYYTAAKKWYFISLPFDVKVSNITSPGCSKAVRYYDGANRASVGTGSNWKNYAQDAIIPAGTGFIYQTSKDCWSEFVAEDNDSKNYVFSKNEFVKALDAHGSEVNANKGWNLVGNPWLSYYNIHKVNFTAPITCWNVSKSTYTAYSIIDDDYAILPGEAFFVQCPDEVNSISFPIDGRQLTNVIESQNAAPPFGEMANTRKLMDIELTDGEQSDQTRFVLNPNAKIDYETSCDASKFFSLDAGVPQIYTIQNGVQMAINERPASDGVVKIGIKVPAAGTYTIKSSRNALTDAVLFDKQNGTESVINETGYTFSTEAGTVDNRFELRLASGNTTGIDNIEQTVKAADYYNLNGQRIETPQKGVYVVNGKKVIVK